MGRLEAGARPCPGSHAELRTVSGAKVRGSAFLCFSYRVERGQTSKEFQRPASIGLRRWRLKVDRVIEDGLVCWNDNVRGNLQDAALGDHPARDREDRNAGS